MSIRRYGPGKFDLIIDSYVYENSLSGLDDEAGDISENGIWYGLFKGSFKVGGALSDFTPQQLNSMTPQEKAFLKKQVGAILSENDQGFVDVSYYANKADLDAAWEGVQESMEEDQDEEMDDL